MRNDQSVFPHPPDLITENMKTINRNGRALGYLDAMDLIAKLPTSTGKLVESETLDRIYSELERGYSERFRRCDHVE